MPREYPDAGSPADWLRHARSDLELAKVTPGLQPIALEPGHGSTYTLCALVAGENPCSQRAPCNG